MTNTIGYGKALEKDKKNKKKNRRGIPKPVLAAILSACGILLIILASVYFAYAREIHAFAENMIHIETDDAADESAGKGITNVLLIGTDARSLEDRARADAIVMVSIVPKTDSITLTSFLRDTCIETAAYGPMKLTDLYAVAGPEMVVESLEEMYSISISDYACVDLCNAWRVLDLLGGADVDLQLAESQQINGLIFELNTVCGEPYGSSYMAETEEGLTHLDGKQAVAYGRIRYSDNDIVRTSRQRNVLKGVFRHWISLAKRLKFGELLAIYNQIPVSGSFIRTTLEAEEFEAFVSMKNMITYSSCKLKTTSIPMEGTWSDAYLENGQQVVLVDDVEKNAKWLKRNVR